MKWDSVPSHLNCCNHLSRGMYSRNISLFPSNGRVPNLCDFTAVFQYSIVKLDRVCIGMVECDIRLPCHIWQVQKIDYYIYTPVINICSWTAQESNDLSIYLLSLILMQYLYTCRNIIPSRYSRSPVKIYVTSLLLLFAVYANQFHINTT